MDNQPVSGHLDNMYYFAYGSNMLTRRLRERVPSSHPLGIGSLRGHVLRFHKRSRDGSGKCNVLRTGDASDLVFGVVYEIDDRDRDRLDRVEGSGYRGTSVEVAVGPKVLDCYTYFARPETIDQTLHPAPWYKDLVLEGAREHELPGAYIRAIERVEVAAEPGAGRGASEGERRGTESRR